MTVSHQSMAIAFLLVCFLIIAGVSVWRIASVVHESHHRTVTLAGPAGAREQLVAEIADDPEEWQKGLMFRSDLPEGTGMLFLFPDDAKRTFWMKNTWIPLDILFFDAAGRFVSRASMEPCTEDPCPLTLSRGQARYVLEVRRGEQRTAAVGEGWMLVIERE